MSKTVCMIALASYPGDPRIRRQAEALDAAGYKVDIICRHSGIQKKVEEFGNVTAHRIMKAQRKDTMIRYLLSSTLFLVLAFVKIQTLAFHRKYRFIQVHNMPDYLIFAAIVQKILGVPLLLDIHDLTVELFEEKWPEEKHKLLKKIVRFGEKISCRVANKVITVSETCGQRLIARGVPAEKITLVFNSADEEIFKYRNREFPKLTAGVKLLYHGTISPRFGIHYAIEAMKEINKKIPGSVLLLYGRYEIGYREYLEKITNELQLTECVEFNGLIPREKIPEIIYKSDVGIIPYPNTDYMNLALPTKAFEYISSGLPVIISRLNDFSLLFPENSVQYIDNVSSQEIAEAVFYLSNNPDIRKNQVENALKKLQFISGEMMKQRYLNLVSLFNSKI
ncbi:MAG TPA: glycosyltransferase family 4 protein [Ignavibacteriaceae bacterium]